MSVQPAQRSEVWRDLVDLAARGRDPHRLLEKLLAEVASGAGFESIALYREREGGWRRVVALGEGFPPRLDPGAPSEPQLEVAFESRESMLVSTQKLDGADLDPQALLALLCAAEAAELSGALKRESFNVNLGRVELQSLYDVGLAIAGTLDLDVLGDEILLRAISLLDARVGAFYLFDEGEYRLQRTFGGEARGRVPADDAALESLLADEEEEKGAPILPGAVHALGAPIEADGRPLGLLAVADKESRTGVGPFAGSDAQTLRLFANQAAIAIENARLHRAALEKERLERELDLAADIQRGLLPKQLPSVGGFELAGWSLPARHVGGDFYDLARADDGALQLVLADVSGKGMPAALLVSTLHSALRLLLDAREFDAGVVERLNRHVVDSSASNKFITMFAARLDPESARLDYVNAGHNPPLVVRAGGTVEELPSGGMPLGLFAGATYTAESIDLATGDLVCIFSDGITECEDPDGEEFGPERLVSLLQEHAAEPVAAVMAEIEGAATRWAAGGPQGDDQTVVLLRKTG